MASTISAGTTAGTAIVVSGDTSGSLALQTNGTTTAVTINTSQNVGIGTASPAYKLDVAGAISTNNNLTFTGTGNRITGDFANATLASRVFFQNSTANANTVVSVMPNGTATQSNYAAFNNSDPTNAAFINLVANATDIRIASSIAGIGTYLPMTFYTGGYERARIDTSGNVGIGGTPSGSYKLQITNGSVYAGLTSDGSNGVLESNGALFVRTNTANPVVFGTGVGATERMRIDSSGNVGIGTSSPGNKLEVNGSFYQYNAYATIGSFNAGTLGTSPSGGTGLGISTNITNGQAEIDLWNTIDPASYANTGILFTQRLTSSTRRDLMFLHNNGNLQFNSGYGSVATAYGCRAWVNFNGTGTVAIRASGNVSSITDNGTGDYTVNFTTAMVDANYSVASIGAYNQSSAHGFTELNNGASSAITTSSCRISNVYSTNTSGGVSTLDQPIVTLAVFR